MWSLPECWAMVTVIELCNYDVCSRIFFMDHLQVRRPSKWGLFFRLFLCSCLYLPWFSFSWCLLKEPICSEVWKETDCPMVIANIEFLKLRVLWRTFIHSHVSVSCCSGIQVCNRPKKESFCERTELSKEECSGWLLLFT